MTAEIAILNKEAVALAADSAGSVGSKVYNINKLFTLSKYNPVGIMFYGNASLLGIPWETIIKIYRSSKLDKSQFNTLEDYSKDFINFLNHNEFFFPKELQIDYFRGTTNDCFNQLSNEIKEKTKEIKLIHIKSPNYRKASEDSYVALALQKVVKEQHDKLEYYINNVCAGSLEDTITKLITAYEDYIEEFKDLYFKEIIFVDEETPELIKRIAAYAYLKNNITGLVIAGFGSNDIFPAVTNYIITGVVNNKLLFSKNEEKCKKITFYESAQIYTYAQSNVMDTFLEGISPEFKTIIDIAFPNGIKEYPDKIISHFIKILKEELPKNKSNQELLEKIDIRYSKIKEKEKASFDSFFEKIMKAGINSNREPIEDALRVLPKEEMAAMAESLINLTSLKHKVDIRDKESVGGSIDVAVISKIDGFIWVKRKHYFDPRLNKQFFDKYFMEDSKPNSTSFDTCN